MKLKFKKMSILFSLLFILLISLAVVSAEEISDSTDLGLSDDSIAIDNEDIGDLNLAAVETGDDDLSLAAVETEGNEDLSSEPESQEPLNANNGDDEVLSADSYSISVKNITANEGTYVNIVANVKNNGASVSGGTVKFALWTANGKDIEEYVSVKDGQATLNIKLPMASETSNLKWLCGAYYYGTDNYYKAQTTFLVEIKRTSIPTKIVTNNILGKMGKKVTLTANVYDDNGLRVNGGTLTFTLNGKSYKVNVKDGKASKTITSPFVGIYKVKVKYNGVGAYKASANSFKLGSDLKILYKYYKTLVLKKGAKKFYKITLTNYFTNKPLKKFKIKFKVKSKSWKTYTLKSNSKGIVKWSAKKLSVGTHKVKICSAYKIFKFNLSGKIIVLKR